MANPTQLQQVLMNLGTNAFQALPGGVGTIEIGLDEKKLVALLENRGDLRRARSQVVAKLHGKPSIAVLPFQNMSGDPTQDYFAIV